MRRLVVAVLGAAVLLCLGFTGTAGASDKGRPTNPPAPSALTYEAADQWVAQYIVRDQYSLSGFTDGSAVMFDPATVELDGANVRAVVRGELYKSYRMQGSPQRSFRDTWTFDCTARTAKVLASEAFPQSNLQGRPAVLDMSNETFNALPADDGEGFLLAQVCSIGSILRSGADRAKAMPPPLEDLSEAGTKAWMQRHVDAGKDVLVYAATGLAVYFNPAEVTKAASGYPRVSVRTELSVLLPEPKTMWRSRREQVELDCVNYRYLQLSHEDYPGSNLIGAASREEGDTVWTEVSAGSVSAKWVRGVCRTIDKGPAVGTPPAPASTSDADVVDWIAAYLNTNYYVVAYKTPKGVLLYGTEDLEVQGDGHVLGVVRLEQYQPDTFGADTIRSASQRVEFDCRAERDRVLSATLYAENNLEGASSPGPERGWEKPPAGSMGQGILRQVCNQTDLFGAAGYAAMPTPLRGTSDADIKAWIAAHVVPDDYVVSGYSDAAAALYSSKELERTRQDYMRVWTRLEFFRPNTMDGRVIRSMRMLVEFDCDEHRSRTLASEVFTGSNLIGTKKEDKKAAADWSFISPNALLSYVANDVCRLRDAADEDARDPAKALPSSAGGQKL